MFCFIAQYFSIPQGQWMSLFTFGSPQCECRILQHLQRPVRAVTVIWLADWVLQERSSLPRPVWTIQSARGTKRMKSTKLAVIETANDSVFIKKQHKQKVRWLLALWAGGVFTCVNFTHPRRGSIKTSHQRLTCRTFLISVSS